MRSDYSFQTQIDRARRRIRNVGSRAPKAGSFIHFQRLIHYGHRVAQHFPVTCLAGFADYPFEQRPPRAMPAGCGPHIEALGFAALRIEAAQCDTADSSVVQPGQAQPAAWKRVFSRQVRHLFIESLKARRETERIPVFVEERAHGFQALSAFHRNDP